MTTDHSRISGELRIALEEDCWNGLHRVALSIQRSYLERLGGHRITELEFEVLKAINWPRGGTPGEVAAAIGLERTQVESALAHLNERSLVRRAGPGFRSRMYLTALGRATIATTENNWRDVLGRNFRPLSNDRLRALSEMLATIK